MFLLVLVLCGYFFFFFSSRRRHTRYIGDWSSDVCSSDLWLRLRSAARRLAPLRGSGLTLLIAFALCALAPLAAALALAVRALHVPAAPFFARREIGRRRLFLLSDNDLGAIGQVGKAGRHHAIGGRQSAGYHRVDLVLLRHHNRFRAHNVAVTDDVAKRARRTALHRRGRYHNRARKRIDLE